MRLIAIPGRTRIVVTTDLDAIPRLGGFKNMVEKGPPVRAESQPACLSGGQARSEAGSPALSAGPRPPLLGARAKAARRVAMRRGVGPKLSHSHCHDYSHRRAIAG